MKKTLYGLLTVLLVIALVGCGGGKKKDDDDDLQGKEMTNEEATRVYEIASEAEYAVFDASSCLSENDPNPLSNLFREAGINPGFKALKDSPLVWTAESGGWYKTTENMAGVILTIYVRYLEASKVIESKLSFSMTKDSLAATFSTISSISSGSDGKFNGNITIKMVVASVGTKTVEYAFKDVDSEAYGSGTYQIWQTIDGAGDKNMERTLFAEFTLSYDETKELGEPPILLTGWCGIGEDRQDFSGGLWVVLPGEEGGSSSPGEPTDP